MIDIDATEAEARGFTRATISEPLKWESIKAQNILSTLWKEIEIRDRRIEALEASLRQALGEKRAQVEKARATP
jgi:hypothetical protein